MLGLFGLAGASSWMGAHYMYILPQKVGILFPRKTVCCVTLLKSGTKHSQSISLVMRAQFYIYIFASKGGSPYTRENCLVYLSPNLVPY